MEVETSPEVVICKDHLIEESRDSFGLSSSNSTAETGPSLFLDVRPKNSGRRGSFYSAQSFYGAQPVKIAPRTILLTSPQKQTEKQNKKESRTRLKKVYFKKEASNGRWWKFKPYESNSAFVQRWEIFMLIPLSYEMWAFPYRLALGVPAISSEMQLTVTDFMFDAIFLIDMVITLCTALPIAPGRPQAVRKFRGIAQHYFCNIFPYQLLPCFPFWVTTMNATNHLQEACAFVTRPELLDMACIKQDRSVWMQMWWVSSAVRMLPRMIRLYAYIKTIESNLEIAVRQLQIFKFAVIIFLSAHWVGCIFYYISRQFGLGPHTWVFQMEILFPNYHRYGSPMALEYLVCVYKGFNALSNLEYIYEFPNNWGEIIFCIFVMVMAIWLEGFILGTLLNYMVDKNLVAEAHKQQMADLKQFIESKNLPLDLGIRLQNHFEFQYRKTLENQASELVELPRSLAVKVSECKYRAVIDKCAARGDAFYNCEEQFLNAMLLKLKVVFYMPGEEIIRKGDLSRELLFVSNGACQIMEDDKVKRVIRHDVPNMAPILGEISFFLGVVQPVTVRAQPDRDVQLLVLSKEDSVELFNSNPEQFELIRKNILYSFGLDCDGEEIGQGQAAPDDGDHLQLKSMIKQAILRQQYEGFSALNFAAVSGDVDAVRELLRKGVDMNSVNYDGRSAFAMACFHGSFKVVELLLEEGVNKDTLSRWNISPFEEAVNNRQGPVAELLTQWKANVGYFDDRGSDLLCEAALRGDTDEVQRLIESKVDVDEGDYDSRTPMYLACQNGYVSVVEVLLRCKGDVNKKDRWGATPLQDAISAGHQQTASVLIAAGGILSGSYGKAHVFQAAARGDVKALSTLYDYAGLKKDIVDFDLRSPLHYAAKDARLLAVSYLMGIASNPNFKDRYGNTALDLALQGGTLYHKYCARLLKGWGGNTGSFGETDEALKLLEDLESISLEDVRAKIDQLLANGYNKQSPVWKTEEELICKFEASAVLSVKVCETKVKMDEAADRVLKQIYGIKNVLISVSNSFIPYLSALPSKSKKISNLSDSISYLLQEVENFKVGNSDNVLDLLSSHFAIDSDEEAKLFDEIDIMMDTQERAESFKGNTQKFLANSVQCTFRRIFDLENAFRLVCEAIPPIEGKKDGFVRDVNDVRLVMESLSVDGLNQYEFEQMFDDGISCMKNATAQRNPKQTNYYVDESKLHVPIAYIIAGSEIFRHSLLNLKTSPTFCALTKTNLGDLLTHRQLSKIAETARDFQSSRIGTTIYATENKEDRWFVLLSGKLRAHVHDSDSDKSIHNGCTEDIYSSSKTYHDIIEGEIFGGFGIIDQFEQSHLPHVSIEVINPSDLLELRSEDLKHLLDDDPQAAARVISLLKDTTWKSLKSVPQSSERRNYEDSDDQAKTAAQLRSRAFNSSSRIFRSTKLLAASSMTGIVLSEIELHSIKTSFHAIECLWRDLSLGMDFISMSMLSGIHDNLGEIGSELFGKMFLNSTNSKQVSKIEFWTLWMEYLSGDLLLDDLSQNDDDDAHTLSLLPENLDQDLEKQIPSLFKRIVSRYHPSRRLGQLFFSDHVLDRYESSFLLVAGDLKKPIPLSKLRDFLDALFPSFPYPISNYNLEETLNIFGRHGAKSKEIFWVDVRKALRDKQGNTSNEDSIFFGKVLNPKSPLMQKWTLFIKFVAIYHFLIVPIRIMFLPWNSMIDVRALYSDLVADVFAVLHVLVQANTSYLSSSTSTWVTDRSKLMRNVDSGFIIAAIPLDWFAFWCGASNEMCCWLRIFKMALPFTILSKNSGGARSDESARGRLMRLAFVVFSIIHVGACIWFYMGSQYARWFPDHAISWYEVDDKLHSISYTEHDKFGMHADSTVWEQYLASFYWVAATITSSGLVGDVIPSNPIEMIFCICLMILNLTLLRFVTGEVSSEVMKADECIINARSKLEAVERLLKDKRIGKHLGDEIRRHCLLTQSSPVVDQASLFSLMSHSLKVEVAACTCREYLDQIALFNGCGEKFLDAVSVLLREVQFAPEEWIYRAGEMANEMFFVASGVVEELGERDKRSGLEVINRTVHRGNGSGELSFFFGMRHLACARAGKLIGASCYRLPRSQFLPLLKLFPDEEERLAEAALTSYDCSKSVSHHSKGSHAQQSVRSGRSGKSGKSGKSGRSKRSRSSAKSGKSKRSSNKSPSFAESSIIGSAVDDQDSGDSDDEKEVVVDDDIHQRIDALKQRRRNDRINQILSAAAEGDLMSMKAALKNESANVCDDLKRTPLHVAASEGQLEIVQYLVDCKADLKAEDQFKNNCLNDAVRHKHDHVAKFLHEKGATLVMLGNTDGVLMCKAAHKGDHSEIQRLLENDVSPNASDYDGRTALHLASSEGHIQLVKFLLDNKADVNIRDNFQGSALEDAVRHGHVSIQRLIRSHGGVLNPKSSAYRMCELAASGDVEAIKILVENGVDSSVGGPNQRTAAHLAASNGMISVLDYLYKNVSNFNVNPIDDMGRTPMEDAKLHGHVVETLFIQERGGLISDDAKFLDHKKALDAKRKEDLCLSRKPLIQASVAESKERASLSFVQEDFVPGLELLIDELSVQSKMIHAAIEEAVPFCKHFLLSIGNPVSSESPHDKYTEYSSEFLLQNTSKIVDKVVSRMHAFGMSASKAMEFLHDVDFPRIKCVQFAASNFFGKTSCLIKLLKTCISFVKKTKSPLLELRTLSSPGADVEKVLKSTVLPSPQRAKVFENHQIMDETSSKLKTGSRRNLADMHQALSDASASPQLQHHNAAEVLPVPIPSHLIQSYVTRSNDLAQGGLIPAAISTAAVTRVKTPKGMDESTIGQEALPHDDDATRGLRLLSPRFNCMFPPAEVPLAGEDVGSLRASIVFPEDPAQPLV